MRWDCYTLAQLVNSDTPTFGISQYEYILRLGSRKLYGKHGLSIKVVTQTLGLIAQRFVAH